LRCRRGWWRVRMFGGRHCMLHQRFDFLVVDSGRRIVADRVQHRVAPLIDVRLFHARDDAVAYFLEWPSTRWPAPVEANDVPAESRLHRLADIALLFKRKRRARKRRIDAVPCEPPESPRIFL